MLPGRLPDHSVVGKKLKAKLERRFLQPYAESNKVKITHIAVTHESFGNHKYTGEFYSKKGHENEPKKTHYSRMVKQINNIIQIAIKYHVRKNFQKPSTLPDENVEDTPHGELKEDCKDNITCVTTNEFYFYPHKEDGPFTQKEFVSLLRLLEKKAAQLPENLHLVLASFPVVNKQRRVSNLTVYIQCKPIPQIDVFAKAFTAAKDPSYPQTISQCYIHKSVLSEEISNYLKELEGLSYCDDIEKDEIKDRLELLFETLNKNPQYKSSQDLILRLAHLLKHFDVIYASGQINTHLRLIAACGEKNIKEISQKEKELGKGVFHYYYSITNLAFGGHVECETASGKKFRTAVEICLDHHNQVALRSLKHEIAQQGNHRNKVMPLYYSHLVSSNIIALESQSRLTNSITQVEPNVEDGPVILYKEEKHLVKEALPILKTFCLHSDFGGNSCFTISEPISPATLENKELAEQIKKQNRTTLNHLLKIFARANHPVKLYQVNEPEKKYEEEKQPLPNKKAVHFFQRPACTLDLLVAKQIITPEQANRLKKVPTFVNLIHYGIVNEQDVNLMRAKTRFLLTDPSSFAYIFDFIKELGEKKFSAFTQAQKTTLFNIPFTTFRAFKMGLLTLQDYLTEPVETRAKINNACRDLYDHYDNIAKGGEKALKRFIYLDKRARDKIYRPVQHLSYDYCRFSR